VIKVMISPINYRGWWQLTTPESWLPSMGIDW